MILQPPQTTHHPRLSTCHRHPTSKPITGFCASCLCERLSSIDSSATPTPTSASTASPRLRRTKSFSSTNQSAANAPSSASEPRRKSCDVRPRTGTGSGNGNGNGNGKTLSNLFVLDDHRRKCKKIVSEIPTKAEPAFKEEEEEIVKVCDEFTEDEGEMRTMKEFIDLEVERKKSSSHVSFWETASFFSKKLLKWKQKQPRKTKTRSEEDNSKPSLRPTTTTTETQSEIGLYGHLGRRSCDTDPRLSVDNARFSFDEPRASWDGYLIGKAYPKLIAPMAAVEEKGSLGNEDDKSPGGSAQTRDYYGEPLGVQRRRRSFDRSSSGKKSSFVDVDEVKSISNAKVSPETVGLFHGAKLLVTEKELRDSNWYSIKDYRAECVEGSKNAVGEKFNFKKSSRPRNVWNMWGLIQKRSESKGGEEDNLHVVDGGLAESWQKIKRVSNGEANGTVSEKLIRSYSVSARNSLSSKLDAGVEAKDVGGGRRRDELLLQRNWSSAYSPNNLDNGLLRFYLTPVRNYRRSKSGRSRVKNSQSTTTNGL